MNWIKSIYHPEAIKITLIWTVAGLFMFLFELVFRFSYQIRSGTMATCFFYILPPLLFGYPFARLQMKLDNMKDQLSLKVMMSIRAILYLGGIFLVYHLIKLTVVKLGAGNILGGYFEIKFFVIWSYFLIIFLAARHVISHFDRKTIGSWLLGEFYQPRQEDRIFLFIDINDSTHIAERIGSKAYFHFLNDFHAVVEKYIVQYQGEIFQYVGDEVVISWKSDHRLKHKKVVELFFTVQDELRDQSTKFIDKYGYAPQIKGALHIGEVTKGEMGKLKKDFAFVGDVLNTTARMYKLCKKDESSLVISRRLLKRLGNTKAFQKVSLGHFKPEGKSDEIHVYALSKKTI